MAIVRASFGGAVMIKSNSKKFISQQLTEFLTNSPTPYHAVSNMATMFEAAKFIRLDESINWDIKPNQSYYCIRNDGAICAWTTPASKAASMRLVGAHTDSPCLKIKPKPELRQYKTLRLGVEVYGGALLSTWFDRDLSLAGRVVVKMPGNQLQVVLVNFKRPIGVVPSLAIHLNRSANSSQGINSQTDLPMVLCIDSATEVKQLLQEQILQEHDRRDLEIMSFELFAYDTQPALITGLNHDFISSARLDNLLSCYLGAKSLIDSNAVARNESFNLFIGNDHEEVGSQSSSGAKGSFLSDVLQRVLNEQLAVISQQSLMLSVDNAHAIHPNYPDKHDCNHGPTINSGPVVKLNSNQGYATNALGASWVEYLAQLEAIPIQKFVVRSDMGCGSTIGPITAAKMGINTVDIGVPQWAMHSVRETAGMVDCQYLYDLLKTFYNYSGSLAITSL